MFMVSLKSLEICLACQSKQKAKYVCILTMLCCMTPFTKVCQNYTNTCLMHDTNGLYLGDILSLVL